MKEMNLYIIPATLFSLLAIISGIAIISVQETITNYMIVSVFSAICGLKYWILYFIEDSDRRFEKKLKRKMNERNE